MPMASKTATVRVTEQGRVTIPKEVRESLGFDGKEVIAEIEVYYDE